MATRMQQRRGTEAQWNSANPILAAGEMGFETDSGKFKIGDGVNNWSDLSYFADAADFDTSSIEATIDSKVATAVSGLVDGAPELLNTLNELAAAVEDDAAFGQTIITSLSLKAPIASPTFTGTPLSTTPATGDDSTKIATTAFVKAQGYGSATDISNLQTNLSTVEVDLDAAEVSLALAESNITTLQTDLGTTQTDLDTAEVAIAAAQSDITTLQTNLSTAEGNITTLQSDVSTAQVDISTAETNITTLQGDLDTAEATLATAVSDLSTHEAATTSVHGIADTAALATKTYADGAATNAQTAAQSYADTALALKADLASPALTGTPTAPTATAGNNSTQVATTAYVDTAVSALVDSAPGALDTLNELAAALGDDANFSTTVTNSLADKAPSASPTFTGTVALPATSSVTFDGTALSSTLSNKADKTASISQKTAAYTCLLYTSPSPRD